VAALLVAVVIPITPGLGKFLGFDPLPLAFWPLLIGVTAAYLVLVETAKYFFNRRFGATTPSGAVAGK
jgi:Mg2+-importing ATPase